MFPILLGLNGLIIAFISYLLIMDPDQFATAVNQRLTRQAGGLVIFLGIITVVSGFCWYSKHFYIIAIILLAGSWMSILYAVYVFLDRQKWM